MSPESTEYSLCSQSTVYVPRVQFMCQLIIHRVQLMFPEYSLCPQSTVYPRVQFMSQSTVYVPRVQFMSSECMSKSTVYVRRVQLSTVSVPEYSLCPQSTVDFPESVPRVQFMSSGSSLCP